MLRWLLRAYIVWSICLDASIVVGVVYYFFIR